MSKRIKVTLDPKSIDAAIAELKKLKQEITGKADNLVNSMANRAVEVAQSGYDTAPCDDAERDAKVHMDEAYEGKLKATVIARGTSVLFMEYGTGVRYPDDHPERVDGVLGRGEYGQGRGKQPNGWYYPATPNGNGTYKLRKDGTEDQRYMHTYGVPASACLYKAKKTVINEFETLARRTYK